MRGCKVIRSTDSISHLRSINQEPGHVFGSLTTILIGNNIVNIMVASIGTLLFVGLYGDIGATISTVVVTIVVLIFGENDIC